MVGSALFFFSGAATLVYQVLWVCELRLLFGSNAESAAIAIAICFAGIAAGGSFLGRRMGRSPNPLRTFGRLEIDDTNTRPITHVADFDGSIWSDFGVFAQPAFAFITADGDVEVFIGTPGERGLVERIEALVRA